MPHVSASYQVREDAYPGAGSGSMALGVESRQHDVLGGQLVGGASLRIRHGSLRVGHAHVLTFSDSAQDRNLKHTW